MKDMILFPEDIDRLDNILMPLTKKASLLLAVLINKDGRLLTNQGEFETVDIVSLGALVAGNSASTQAIAHLVGETEFSSMYHQGKDKHIYIASVDDETFLALIFDDRTNIDRVKVFARQFDRQLKDALVQVYNKTEDQVDLDWDMNNVLFGPPGSQPGAPQAQQPPAYMPLQQAGDIFYMDMNKKQ
jgi:predicted regulator of Ras-like GTPase activity (Roadblock/LC7/MglB family)